MQVAAKWQAGTRCFRRIDAEQYPARVVFVNDDGTLDLSFDDGTNESKVDTNECEPLDDISNYTLTRSPPSGSKCDLSLKVLKSGWKSMRRSLSLSGVASVNLSINLLPLASRCSTCAKHCIWRCRRCSSAFYCSKNCQNLGYARHKPECVERPFKPLFTLTTPTISLAGSSTIFLETAVTPPRGSGHQRLTTEASDRSYPDLYALDEDDLTMPELEFADESLENLCIGQAYHSVSPGDDLDQRDHGVAGIKHALNLPNGHLTSSSLESVMNCSTPLPINRGGGGQGIGSLWPSYWQGASDEDDDTQAVCGSPLDKDHDLQQVIIDSLGDVNGIDWSTEAD